ncbi:MAG TPA: ATP-dependent 6-phosphofructokinase [Candidatus Dormibacteraeota bacterium]|nr:ATP-dependent 6-phosphofructokinase [Candidatus Dormibacteraeota bacterium]
MRIGVLTGGGDAPGLNAAIRAVVRRAFELGHRVSGIKNGWAGALSGDMMDLEPATVRGILPLGGTILGTSRTNPLREPDGVSRVCATLLRYGVDGLVAIGGDDTLSVAKALHENDFRVVGVPKTIDNDLCATEFCIGFDTAAGIVAEALDRLHTTASAHHRVMVVEVMGRDTGWVACAGGLAGGADLIVIPEYPVELADVVQHLHRRRGEGRDFSIIVVAEGVSFPGLATNGEESMDAFGHVQLAKRGVGDALSRRIEQETGFETRVTVLGHLQRGGSPSSVDRIWATRLGVAATELLDRGEGGVAPVRRDGTVAVAPLSDLLAEIRRVPRELYELTRIFN